MTSFAVSSGRRVPFEDSTCFFIGSKFRCMRNTPTEHDTLTALWVQVWVQLKKEKWLPISRKRHQMGHLDFRQVGDHSPPPKPGVWGMMCAKHPSLLRSSSRCLPRTQGDRGSAFCYCVD